MASKTNKNGADRKPKGPEVAWNDVRDYALVVAVAGGNHNTASLATELSNDPAFVGVPDGAITAAKVRLRLATLRKKGVAIPQFARGGRGGYTVDVNALNGLLGAGDATA